MHVGLANVSISGLGSSDVFGGVNGGSGLLVGVSRPLGLRYSVGELGVSLLNGEAGEGLVRAQALSETRVDCITITVRQVSK